MGGNISGGNFLGGNFPGGNFPGGDFPRTIFYAVITCNKTKQNPKTSVLSRLVYNPKKQDNS